MTIYRPIAKNLHKNTGVNVCILDDTYNCDNCGECNRCDLNNEKLCDNCGKCLDEVDFNGIIVEKIIKTP